jgi:hypothetical protein
MTNRGGLLLAVLGILAAAPAGAANHSIYIHGFTGLSSCGATPSGWCYWNGTAQPGVGAVAANYNGTQHLSTSSPAVKTVLDNNCTGANWCYIAAHSMGGSMIGYLESVYPGRWNIYWVDVAGSAAGGSELANAVDWANNAVHSLTGYGYGAISDLTTSNMGSQSFYNHDKLGDSISGAVYTFMGGDWATYDNSFFPGSSGNDIVVGYSSSGHYRSYGGYQNAPTSCNTSNWTNCTGTNAWDYTVNAYCDDYYWGSYYHVWGVSPWTGGSGPIINLMTSDMSSNAL